MARFWSLPLRGLLGFVHVEISGEHKEGSPISQAVFSPLLASHWLMSQ